MLMLIIFLKGEMIIKQRKKVKEISIPKYKEQFKKDDIKYYSQGFHINNPFNTQLRIPLL